MITIQKILGNELFDVMLNKINDNFTQLAKLNGGPQGKPGSQGLPGLPGFQGKQGTKGENGFDGARTFLVKPNDDPDALGLLVLPPESQLPMLIANHTYAEGDIFIWYDITSLKHKVSKIVKTSHDYMYQTYFFNEASIGDDMWIKFPSGDVYGLPSERTFLIRDIDEFAINPPDPDRKNFGYLHNGYVDFRKTDTELTANTTLHGSGDTGILNLFNKAHFKFSSTQSTAPRGIKTVGQPDFYIDGGLYNRIPNMYNIISEIDASYASYTVWDSGLNLFNDPTSGDGGGGGKLSIFDYIRSAAPVLYLHGVKTQTDGEPNDDSNFHNFGFLLQKVQSSRFGSNERKSILILASDEEGENDVYFRQNKIWGESSFLSEINVNSQTKNYRLYSAILSPHQIGSYSAITYEQLIGFGLSTYYDDGTGNGHQIKLMTGFEMKNDGGLTQTSQIGSINGFIANNALSSTLKTNATTRRDQFMRVDNDGNVMFMSTKESGIAAYESANALNDYNAKFLIRSGINTAGKSILRIENLETLSSAFSVDLNGSGYHSTTIGAGFVLKTTAESASFYVRGKNGTTDWTLYNHQVSDTHNFGVYNGVHAQLSIHRPQRAGYAWGFSYGNPLYGNYSYNMGLSERTPGFIQTTYQWLYKKWASGGSLDNYTDFTTPLTTPPHEEVALAFEKCRFQMNMGDAYDDISDLTDKIMVSRSANGEGQWAGQQSVINRHSVWYWPESPSGANSNMPNCDFSHYNGINADIVMNAANHKFIYVYSDSTIALLRQRCRIYLPGVPYAYGSSVIDDIYNGMEIEFLFNYLANPVFGEENPYPDPPDPFVFEIISSNGATGGPLNDILNLTPTEWSYIQAGYRFYLKVKLLKYGTYNLWWQPIERKFLDTTP